YLEAAGTERIEQLFLIRIDRLDARVSRQRRYDQRERGGDRDLGGEPQSEHQDHQWRQSELRQRLEADDVRLHDGGVVARPPKRQSEQRTAGGADQKSENR